MTKATSRPCPQVDPLGYHMYKVKRMFEGEPQWYTQAFFIDYLRHRQLRKERLLLRRQVKIIRIGGFIGTPTLMAICSLYFIAAYGLIPELFDTNGALSLMFVSAIPLCWHTVRKATWLYWEGILFDD